MRASQLTVAARLCSCLSVDLYIFFPPFSFPYGVGLWVWLQSLCVCLGVHHCEVGISGSHVEFLTTHISICCFTVIAPCSSSSSCCLWMAAAMDSSQSLLVWCGCPRWCLSVCAMSPKSVLASWPSPIAYICLIFSFVSHSRIASQFCSDSWSMLFHCSHMSHAMFHYFW